MKKIKFPKNPSFFKKILSYFYPVSIAESEGSINDYLEIYLYKNQWQLATETALYSDGNRYAPFRIAFKQLGKAKLSVLNEVLVLGCGLGSSVQILTQKYNCKAKFSLVELDSQILEWVTTLLGQMEIKPVQEFNEDAYAFLLNTKQQYDLICIDIFIDRTVPPQFLTIAFFELIKSRLKKDGIWVMNYMASSSSELEELKGNIGTIFNEFSFIQKRENFIFIVGGKNAFERLVSVGIQ